MEPGTSQNRGLRKVHPKERDKEGQRVLSLALHPILLHSSSMNNTISGGRGNQRAGTRAGIKEEKVAGGIRATGKKIGATTIDGSPGAGTNLEVGVEFVLPRNRLLGLLRR